MLLRHSFHSIQISTCDLPTYRFFHTIVRFNQVFRFPTRQFDSFLPSLLEAKVIRLCFFIKSPRFHQNPFFFNSFYGSKIMSALSLGQMIVSSIPTPPSCWFSEFHLRISIQTLFCCQILVRNVPQFIFLVLSPTWFVDSQYFLRLIFYRRKTSITLLLIVEKAITKVQWCTN